MTKTWRMKALWFFLGNEVSPSASMRVRGRPPIRMPRWVLASLLVAETASVRTTAGAGTRGCVLELGDDTRATVERSRTVGLQPGCEPTYDQPLLAAHARATFSGISKRRMDQVILDAAVQGKGEGAFNNSSDPILQSTGRWSHTEKSAAGIRHPHGTLRVHDPATNPFGSVNPNGRRRPLSSRPEVLGIWDQQTGSARWTPK